MLIVTIRDSRWNDPKTNKLITIPQGTKMQVIEPRDRYKLSESQLIIYKGIEKLTQKHGRKGYIAAHKGIIRFIGLDLGKLA